MLFRDTYVLVESRVPPIIPLGLAEKVLLLGNIVRVLTLEDLLDQESSIQIVNKLKQIFFDPRLDESIDGSKEEEDTDAIVLLDLAYHTSYPPARWNPLEVR